MSLDSKQAPMEGREMKQEHMMMLPQGQLRVNHTMLTKHHPCHKMGVAVNATLLCCAVSLDGKQLAMGGSETVQQHEMMLPQGKLRLTWELYRPNYGNTITIETGENGCILLKAACCSNRMSSSTPSGQHFSAAFCTAARRSESLSCRPLSNSRSSGNKTRPFQEHVYGITSAADADENWYTWNFAGCSDSVHPSMPTCSQRLLGCFRMMG